MYNLFHKPIEKTSFESWAKVSDDIAIVAILACPVILYGKDLVYWKLINLFLLSLSIYLFLVVGRIFRLKSERGN